MLYSAEQHTTEEGALKLSHIYIYTHTYIYIYIAYSNKFHYSKGILFHEIPSPTGSTLNLVHGEDEKNLCPVSITESRN